MNKFSKSFSWLIFLKEHIFVCFFFFKNLFYLFLERGREKEGERHQCVLASCPPPTGAWPATQARALDWEWNRWPIGSQAGTQTTEPH